MSIFSTLKLVALIGWLPVSGALYAQCPTTVTLNARLSGVSRTEQASQSLTASNEVSKGNVVYKAGQSISLTAGFVVRSGTDFSATIKPCSSALQKPKAGENKDLSISAYPNPFATNTLIEYALPKSTRVSVVVYDEKGTEVDRILSDMVQPEGTHKVTFNSEKLALGLYLCTLNTPEGRKVCKMIKQE